MKRRTRPLVAAMAALIVAALAQPAGATFPFPPGTADPYDYTQLHIEDGNCPPDAHSDLPKGFSCTGDFKLTNAAPRPGDTDYDPTVENNPQELWGVRGPGTNRAWEVTTGRPDTIISVLDSGIEWSTPELANKVHLNLGELPVPCSVACAATYGTTLQQYDANHDGVLNVRDYANDPRVTDANADKLLDPEDLITAFSDGTDQDGNGYADDIAGWDFYEGDNDPADDVHYKHGTGEARDSSAEIELRTTQCPNCMFEPLRVGDSFIADINDFAQAAIYAVDNGVSVIQEALGTLNHTAFAQAAVDYAYHHGVLVVASEADEEAGHHNYPAALNHTMVVNSVTHAADVPGTPIPGQAPESYLTFNGCTNFGGYTWVSVESASCSSDATGQGSGMAGLLYSAARNAVDEGLIAAASDGAGRPLSAEEAKQLIRVASDDVDFSTPRCATTPSTGAPGCGPPNNFATALADSQRYVTTGGWDQITGWGRDDVQRAVNLVMAGRIPPEVDITSPVWWAPLGTTGSVPVRGRVAAPRAPSYTYEVQLAPGVQSPPWPGRDAWTTAYRSGKLTSPVNGTLTSIDLAKVRAAIAACSSPPPAAPGGCSAPYGPPPFTDPTSQDHPEKDAFRVRVVVCANRKCPPNGAPLERDPSVAIEQRQFFSTPRAGVQAGFPKYLNADGAGSPAFAPLKPNGPNALILADGNGYVHAFLPNGHEAQGFPVHTDPIPLPATGSNAYTRGAVPTTVYSPVLLGSPVVAPLLGPGKGNDIAVTALDGKLYAWDHAGRRLAGFPVDSPERFSTPDARTHWYKPFHGFTAMPAAGDLDPSYPGLELVVGSNDTHIYAFHADGTPVPGWPVFVGDPTKIASMDPTTDTPTYESGSGVNQGGKIIAGVSLGDVFGEGMLEVGVNVNEEYDAPLNGGSSSERPNWSGARAPVADVLGNALGGNTRTYLLWPDGTNHPQTSATQTTANPYDQAYVPGWPVKIGLVLTELLPDVGEGSDGAPVMADVNGDGKLEIGTASYAGAPYLLNGDGTSFYGDAPDGYVTMASEAAEGKGTSTDFTSLAALGGGVFGRLGGDGSPLSFAMGAAGLRRLLDAEFPDQQLGADDQISAWDATTGTYDPGFPAVMNDLQFFTTPAIADVNGDGQAEVLEGSAMYDLRAYSLGGLQPSGWPKFTGGWMVTTPAVGAFGQSASVDVAAVTREGYLWLWQTGGSACQGAEWPKYQHDLWNTGDYDGRAPTGRPSCRA